jgi:small subunit ribosomal protein S3Ae
VLTRCARCSPAEIASEGLKGRVFEVNLGDLQEDPDQVIRTRAIAGGGEGERVLIGRMAWFIWCGQSWRKIKLVAEDVQGNNILTNFHGLDLTR